MWGSRMNINKKWKWLTDNVPKMTEAEHKEFCKCNYEMVMAEYKMQKLYEIIKHRIDGEVTK